MKFDESDCMLQKELPIYCILGGIQFKRATLMWKRSVYSPPPPPLSTTFLMIGIAHPSIVLLIIREGPAEMGLRYMILKVSFVLSGALKKAVKYIKMNISDI